MLTTIRPCTSPVSIRAAAPIASSRPMTSVSESSTAGSRSAANRAQAASRTADEQDLVALQDRFARGLTWLRRFAGKSQRDVAEFVGWHQPYVARLENPAESSLLKSLSLLESYAQACGATTLVTFVKPETGEIVGRLPLSEAAEAAADRLRLADPLDETVRLDFDSPDNRHKVLARGAART